MRFRRMRHDEMQEVISIYESRFPTATGLVRRNKERWKLFRRSKDPSIYWLVAVDGGRIVAYITFTEDKTISDLAEAVWRPEYDGTDLGERLVREAFRRIMKTRPALVTMWGMAGSLILSVPRPEGLAPLEAGGILMAGIVDTRALMRDLRPILNKRVNEKLCLHIGGRAFIYGRKGGQQTCAWTEGSTVLGLILGTTSLADEISKGGLRYEPKTKESLLALKEAFPKSRFWIEDGW